MLFLARVVMMPLGQALTKLPPPFLGEAFRSDPISLTENDLRRLRPRSDSQCVFTCGALGLKVLLVEYFSSLSEVDGPAVAVGFRFDHGNVIWAHFWLRYVAYRELLAHTKCSQAVPEFGDGHSRTSSKYPASISSR